MMPDPDFDEICAIGRLWPKNQFSDHFLDFCCVKVRENSSRRAKKFRFLKCVLFHNSVVYWFSVDLRASTELSGPGEFAAKIYGICSQL